eukprot:ANDGO_00328.mRNA.1 ATP-dependent DNA helicase pfh1
MILATKLDRSPVMEPFSKRCSLSIVATANKENTSHPEKHVARSIFADERLGGASFLNSAALQTVSAMPAHHFRHQHQESPVKAERTLTSAQQRAIQAACSGENVFLTGPGGVGKSFTLHKMIDELRKRKRKNVAVAATTGIAAGNLTVGAGTWHGFMGIGVGEGSLSTLLAKARFPFNAKRMVQTDILVLDEVSLADPVFWCKCDLLLRFVRNSPHRPFGGMQLIVCGDFFQLPPVTATGMETGTGSSASRGSHLKQMLFGSQIATKGTEKSLQTMLSLLYCGKESPVDAAVDADVKIHTFVFETESWGLCNFDCVQLEQVHRQSESCFVTALSEIRHGEISSKTLDLLYSRKTSLLRDRAPHSSFTDQEWTDFITAVPRMYAHRKVVDKVNHEMLQKLCTETSQIPKQFTAVLSSSSATADAVALEKFASDLSCGMTVELCIGALVILTTNDYRDDGLYNGSVGTVVRWADLHGYPVVRFRQPACSCSPTLPNALQSSLQKPVSEFLDIVVVPRTWSRTDFRANAKLECKQVPLVLGWATSIHKGQGMTLDCLRVSIGTDIFAVGMAYVALSRVRALEGLFLDDVDVRAIRADPKVKVFYESIQNGLCETDLVSRERVLEPFLALFEAVAAAPPH